MVFEQYFKVYWVERKEHSFFLGFVYAILGILSAIIIFPNTAGPMSVAFTSILLIPTLAALLKIEENVEIREKKFAIGQLFRDHKDIFKVYICMFFGIMLAYGIVTIFLGPQYFAIQLNRAGIFG